MDFLPGALDLDPGAFPVDPGFAGRVLWFDALVGNVDRTWRNVNMLRWHGAPYLIDHGATLTFHHGWSGPSRPTRGGGGRAALRRVGARAARRPARRRPDLDAADAALAPLVTSELVRAAVALVPDRWLDVPGFAGPARSATPTSRAAGPPRRPGRVAAAAAGGDHARPARSTGGRVAPPARQIWRRPP